eukprot:CAMPEP_0167802216 /NCGR_PEP_ID=MMETSP0111_2-20121227/18980_1 /TAXON_ID=91324 /ORGANISM="Lotharella globosa, Strain CCCM811" /LENGTH=115 /DNA_ID=CAMNT_0007698195 /DNA_START=97 /DNA_END=444 /DNA_ORIENTATION=+
MSNPRSARTARKDQKEKDMKESPEPRIQFVTMDEKMLESAFETAREGYMQKQRGELAHWRDVARKIKEKFDVEFSKAKVWNCVVGKDFGSFVSFNAKNVAYFYIAEMGVLLWKHA